MRIVALVVAGILMVTMFGGCKKKQEVKKEEKKPPVATDTKLPADTPAEPETPEVIE